MEEKENAQESTPELIKEIWRTVLGNTEEKADDEAGTD